MRFANDVFREAVLESVFDEFEHQETRSRVGTTDSDRLPDNEEWFQQDTKPFMLADKALESLLYASRCVMIAVHKKVERFRWR